MTVRRSKHARPLWGRRSTRRHFVVWRARNFEYRGDQRDCARGRAEYFGVKVECVSRSWLHRKTPDWTRNEG